MKRLYTPSVPELFRIDASSKDSAKECLEVLYKQSSGGFNYLPATKSVKAAFKGFHNLSQLVAGCESSKTAVGRKSNVEVVSLAAPVAFQRSTRVFPFPKRQFHFGRDRASAFRVPFFFVEANVIKVCFLQPRKYGGLSEFQLGGLFKVLKSHLLDREFYGDSTDIEYIDASVSSDDEHRTLCRRTLSDVELWDDFALERHLTLISEALDELEADGLAAQVKGRRPFKDPDLPLFD